MSAVCRKEVAITSGVIELFTSSSEGEEEGEDEAEAVSKRPPHKHKGNTNKTSLSRGGRESLTLALVGACLCVHPNGCVSHYSG